MQNIRNYVTTTNKPGKAPLLDRMMKAYMGSEDVEAALNNEDQLILQRWKVVHMLSLQHRPCISTRNIVNTLIKDFGVSEITAVRDISNAQKLFGHINKANKDFKRAIYVEWLEQIASLAEIKGDLKSAVAALDKAQEILRLGIKDDDEEGRRGNKSFTLNMFFDSDGMVGKKSIDLTKVDEFNLTDFKEVLAKVDRPRVDISDMQTMLEAHKEKEVNE